MDILASLLITLTTMNKLLGFSIWW